MEFQPSPKVRVYQESRLGWIAFCAPEVPKLKFQSAWLQALRVQPPCRTAPVKACWQTDGRLLSQESDLTSYFSDKIEVIWDQALLWGPYLPITESLNLPVSAFIPISFLPVTIRGARGLSSSLEPCAQIQPLLSHALFLSLLCPHLFPLYWIIPSSKHSPVSPIFKKKKSFFDPPPIIVLSLWALLPFMPSFSGELSTHLAPLQWGPGRHSMPSDLNKGPATIYTPTGTLVRYSRFLN